MFSVEYNETLNKIFSECWNHAMTNIIVLLPISNQSLLLSTYFPYKNNCNTLTRYDFETFTFETNNFNLPFEKLFPNKVNDFDGCTINVGTYTSPPYSIIKNGTVDGVNRFMLNMISEAYNFKINYQISDNENNPSYLFADGTAGGLFKLVIESMKVIFCMINFYNQIVPFF